MKRAGMAAITLGAGFAGWTVAASYLLVHLGGLAGKLGQPWLAWWLYATNNPHGWTAALLAVSGTVPLLVAGTVIFGAWRLRHFCRRFRRSLYGDSTWAADAEMRDGGIRSRGSPF